MNAFNHKKELQKIIERYLAGKANADEIRFVEAYYAYLGENKEPLALKDLQKLEAENLKAIQAKIAQTKKTAVISFYKYAAAAAILLCAGSLLYLNRKSDTPALKANIAETQLFDVSPGSNKAILTLSNGEKVILDDRVADILDQDGLKISKTNNGQLIYTVLDRQDLGTGKTLSYNTIQTPKGGQYQVFLPDGTKVWLNAASSLKYPEVFKGGARRVELTGEAYFEVAKNKAMPFYVKSMNQEVEVLGTHFNINAYPDERVTKTTLLEGQVNVHNLMSAQILKPGQQSISDLTGNTAIRLITHVDTDDEIAWKNGLFQFDNANLKTILNQLERWYDINIDYSSVPDKKYNGMVPRKANLSEVLKMLEKTGNIRFKLREGKNLTVVQGQ